MQLFGTPCRCQQPMEGVTLGHPLLMNDLRSMQVCLVNKGLELYEYRHYTKLQQCVYVCSVIPSIYPAH